LILELPRPDGPAREKIFEIHLRKKPLSSEVRISTLARLTDGRTGGDIAFVCKKAAMLAVRDYLKTGNNGDFLLEWRHFEAALEGLRELPSCRPGDGAK
ncbi:MAG: AAA family ATPase, partial [Synergistaceae bacterium]|nr:AAA family ATPase [Synergistaceae bacterium]